MEKNTGVIVGRAFFMYLVVLHHCCCHSMLSSTITATLLFVPTLCAVDGFVAISGWFGLRFAWIKVFRLLGCVLFYSCIYGLLGGVKGVSFYKHFHLGFGWFTSVYIALLFFAPLINAGLETLAMQKTNGDPSTDGVCLKGVKYPLISAWGLVAILLVCDFLGQTFHLGFSVSGFGSYTFITLLFMYLTLRVIRLLKCKLPTLRTCIYWMIGLLSVMLVITGSRLVKFHGAWCVEIVKPLLYNSPITIAVAILALLFFVNWQPPKWLTKIASFCGPSIFCVYLLHDANGLGRSLWIKHSTEWLVMHTDLPTVIILIGLSIGVFIGTILVDLLIRRLPLYLLKRMCAYKLHLNHS